MNGVPMKLDYSKTINEQLDTFNYYKDRYASYELELIKDRQQITQLTNNWNELEKYIKDNLKELLDDRKNKAWSEYYDGLLEGHSAILDKMKEIKEGK